MNEDLSQEPASAEPADDYFGLCPYCHREPEYVNDFKESYAVCSDHKVFWWIGHGIFSSWQEETEADWRRNRELLETCQEVEPFRWPVDDSEISDASSSEPEEDDRPDDHFGLCPYCHREPEYVNDFKESYAICSDHKVFWWIGHGIFSSWQEETEADWQRNRELLKTYEMAEPFHWPEDDLEQ